MAENSAKSASRHDMPGAFQMPDMSMFGSMFGGDLMAAYFRTGKALFDQTVALNAEIARFAGSRVQANMDLLQALPGCTTVEKLAALQSEHVRSTMKAYADELPRLTTEVTRTCAGAWAPAFDAASEPGRKKAA